MRLVLFLFLCGLIKSGFSQSNKNVKIIRQKSFEYSDTVLGKIYLGDYEATGIIRGMTVLTWFRPNMQYSFRSFWILP